MGWLAILIGVLVIEFVRPHWVKRTLVFGLLFFCLTGCQ